MNGTDAGVCAGRSDEVVQESAVHGGGILRLRGGPGGAQVNWNSRDSQASLVAKKTLSGRARTQALGAEQDGDEERWACTDT